MLLVLVILSLAAVVMLDASRRGLRHAAAAVEAEHELQTRWGAASVRRSVLPQIDAILEGEIERRDETMSEFNVTVNLGGQRFDLVLADEQAKVNLNALYQERGADAVRRVADEAVGAVSNHLIVDLTPDPRFDPDAMGLAPRGQSLIVQPLGSWSQVFRAPTADRLLGKADAEHRPLADLTCWGDGWINLLRASPQAIAGRVGDLLSPGEIERLIERRTPRAPTDSSPDDEPRDGIDTDASVIAVIRPDNSLLSTLDLTDRQRESLEAMIIEESRCQSLTIRIEHGGWRHHELSILMSPAATAETVLREDLIADERAVGGTPTTGTTPAENNGPAPASSVPLMHRFVW